MRCVHKETTCYFVCFSKNKFKNSKNSKGGAFWLALWGFNLSLLACYSGPWSSSLYITVAVYRKHSFTLWSRIWRQGEGTGLSILLQALKPSSKKLIIEVYLLKNSSSADSNVGWGPSFWHMVFGKSCHCNVQTHTNTKTIGCSICCVPGLKTWFCVVTWYVRSGSLFCFLLKKKYGNKNRKVVLIVYFLNMLFDKFK